MPSPQDRDPPDRSGHDASPRQAVEREMSIRFGYDLGHKAVVVDFGKAMTGLGMTVEQARDIAARILDCAAKLETVLQALTGDAK